MPMPIATIPQVTDLLEIRRKKTTNRVQKWPTEDGSGQNRNPASSQAQNASLFLVV
jgi:hypothetical protein